MSDFTRPVEDLSGEAKEYIDLRLDELKLRTVRGLSITLTKLVGLFLMLGVLTALLLVLSFACVLLLGELMGSYAGAAFIVAGVLLVGFVLLVVFRDRLFKNTFVPLFVKLFFPSKEDEA